MVAVFPYSSYKSDIIYLRYLKLINFDKYLGYMVDNLSEFVSNVMNVEQIKTMVQMIRLVS